MQFTALEHSLIVSQQLCSNMHTQQRLVQKLITFCVGLPKGQFIIAKLPLDVQVSRMTRAHSVNNGFAFSARDKHFPGPLQNCFIVGVFSQQQQQQRNKPRVKDFLMRQAVRYKFEASIIIVHMFYQVTMKSQMCNIKYNSRTRK
ncbi:CLUMA_CG016829, isoform A [Clunio marinus]|uniref:CLUMA_CG016829, isoform A n=1 Tax=Clunio marinus TaxID=568069 RepID=A0A1J1IV79_9DIPT|nr:CLUMA_CG016829, isoform A [Clunio marinus]